MTAPSAPDDDGETASPEGERVPADTDEPEQGGLLDRVARTTRRLWGDPPEETGGHT